MMLILKRMAWVIAGVLGVLALLYLVAILYMRRPEFGRLPEGERLRRIEASPNYRDGAFHYPMATPRSTAKRSFFDVMWDNFFNVHPDATPRVALPHVRTDLSALAQGGDALVWFGHSGYYLQLGGVRMLVDPTLESASPVGFFGGAFKGADAYRAKDLPAVDYLIITHDHWDHLDYETIQEIKARVGHYVVPLGVGAHLEHWGVAPQDITELDWWEDVELKAGLRVTALPARHYSGRTFHRNATLWASYMVQAGERNVYLGGDSGYGPHFAQIGERFPSIDLALLENGQYNEDWANIHTLPDELASIARELKPRRIFTGHNSKYRLARHAWYEPLERASETAERQGLHLLTPMIGQVVHLQDSTQTFSKWWQAYK